MTSLGELRLLSSKEAYRPTVGPILLRARFAPVKLSGPGEGRELRPRKFTGTYSLSQWRLVVAVLRDTRIKAALTLLTITFLGSARIKR